MSYPHPARLHRILTRLNLFFPYIPHRILVEKYTFPDRVLVGWGQIGGHCASNLLQHATKLHSVCPSCSTCRRPVKIGKLTNLISATIHLAAGSAVSGIMESPADVVRWGPSDTELQLRGLTTNRVASFARKGREGNSAGPKQGNHFYCESDCDRVECCPPA
jgi:hypothetical protein